MSFLDTSFVVALVRPADDLHRLAMHWSSVIQGPLLTTDFVVVEIVNFLSRINNRQRAQQALHWLQSDEAIEIVEASRTLLEAGIQLHNSRPDKDWSLTDCISFHVMKEREIARALTYDHHFEQAGFEALLRKEPPSA